MSLATMALTIEKGASVEKGASIEKGSSVENGSSVIAAPVSPVPLFNTSSKVFLLSSGSDGDGISEIKGYLKTTVIGRQEKTIEIDKKFPDNFTGSVLLASFSQRTFFLPVIFSVLVKEDDFNPDEIILKRAFDFGTVDTPWASGQPFNITGSNGGFTAAVEFKVTLLNG